MMMMKETTQRERGDKVVGRKKLKWKERTNERGRGEEVRDERKAFLKRNSRSHSIE